MENFEVQKLRDLPIEGVAGRGGLKIARHKCLCPWHLDHKPSLTFNVAKNTARCYACGVYIGNPIDLTMKLLNLPFLEACKWLADEHNVILTEYKSSSPKGEVRRGLFDASRYARYFEHPWLSPDACKFLFEKRRLHPAVVRYCRLNSYKDWLQIPYYSQDRKLIGIQRRYMGTDPEQPRFLFQQGAEGSHLYNLPVLKLLRPKEDLYISEGVTDCLALMSAQKCKAIAIPSATLFNAREFKKELMSAHVLENENTLHIYPDRDMAGERVFNEILSTANESGFQLIRHDLPDGCKDFSDYWMKEALTVNVNS